MEEVVAGIAVHIPAYQTGMRTAKWELVIANRVAVQVRLKDGNCSEFDR
jgi:hypothetical protein